ncbi:DUF4468 domain-containing protein [Cytophagaceae bacterium DM2B3-1]|uniref:DUF4468 domain-containing protein n=2 Tax=Xanthocytophaga TaxID=3078918 RepID=A0ABT7CEA9_9BACT|nr:MULTISPECIES: DUF4468 domain-containing protein [Xanthocytophaga]MDJ1473121.1 DUF4468 domain-containing protein [Xanthocytophaga flavus]MDJ1491982.1 DUF4468 domain-containing protein [Xanthocytophaga flavus]MDJ1502628.1 DUF4468 domain-containing protein [Xanthocytophaga agilis]
MKAYTFFHPNFCRNLVGLFLFLCGSFSWAQSLQMAQSNGLVAYSETIEVPGVSKAQLIERAQNWLNSNKNTISFISEEMGMVSMGSEVPFTSEYTNKKASTDGRVVYVATLLIKDGIFMYEFNNFYHEANPKLSHPVDLGFVTVSGVENKELNKEWKQKDMESMRKQVDVSIQKNIDALKKALLNENLSFNFSVNGN